MKKIIKKLTIAMLFIFVTLTMMSTITKLSSLKVEAAPAYKENPTDFRAAWVSYYTGDIRYNNQEQYKGAIDTILDTLEYYNMNAIIFHVRANHDAWYKSEINRRNSQLSSVNFDEFDPLEYVITESHKRGIEFHAWMNPYRIGSTYDTKEEVVNTFSEYPNNPASSAENVLIGSTLQILDPGRPAVRDFLIDTCLELVENYDVDAIHFDDYFYASGIDDTATRNLYNNGLSVANFRRKQVDTFIEDLSNTLSKFNKDNKRYVQLGIAPTGVYQNASSSTEANTALSNYQYDAHGNLTYPKGATMGCQNHYESYLYCDTLKWVNNEWIDYIIPQTYWSTTHSKAPFEKLINWWNKAVQYKDVNLYSGMGIYMWLSQTGEAFNHVSIVSNLDNVLGTSIYSYDEVYNAYKRTDPSAYTQMLKVKTSAWYDQAILPELKSFERVNPGRVEDLIIADNTLSFSALEDAKFYVIYRDTEMIDYSSEQIIDIIGSDNDYVVWEDEQEGNYVYDVVPLSYTNTLGEPTVQLVEDTIPNLSIELGTTSDGANKLPVARSYNLQPSTTAYVFLGSGAPDNSRLSYNWSSSDESIATISEYGTITTLKEGTTKITGIYKEDSTKFCDFYLNVATTQTAETFYKVKFIENDGTILKEETVKYGGSATPPTNVTREPSQKYIYTFAGWSEIYSNITSNLEIQAIYDVEFQTYEVTYKNPDGTILKVEEVKYGHPGTPPTNPKMDPTVEYYYRFLKWQEDYSSIIEDTIINAVYSQMPNLYELSYETNGGNSMSPDYYYHSDNAYAASNPTKEGYVFGGWYLDEHFIEKCTFPMHLTKDTVIYAKWLIEYEINFFDMSGSKINTIKVLSGGTLPSYEAPLVMGYDFIGWSATQNGSEILNSTTIINQNHDLYPVYTVQIPEYTVEFYDYAGNILSTQKIKQNSKAVAPDVPTREGYKFIGWDQSFDQVNANLEVFPIYEKIENTNDKNCSCSNSTYLIISSIGLLSTALLILRKKSR